MDKEQTYELGQTYIRFDFKADREFKNALKKYLLFKGKIYAHEYFPDDLVLKEFYFFVETEEGSLKSRLKIYGIILASGVIGYGELRNGLDYLIKDAQAISNHIVRDIMNEPNIDPESIGRVERRLGVPGKLKRLYDDIETLNTNTGGLLDQRQIKIVQSISRRYNELINVLDQPMIEHVQSDLRKQNVLHLIQQNQLPNSDNQLQLPEPRAIREQNEYEFEDRILLIGEEKIINEPTLPPPSSQ